MCVWVHPQCPSCFVSSPAGLGPSPSHTLQTHTDNEEEEGERQEATFGTSRKLGM